MSRRLQVNCLCVCPRKYVRHRKLSQKLFIYLYYTRRREAISFVTDFFFSSLSFTCAYTFEPLLYTHSPISFLSFGYQLGLFLYAKRHMPSRGRLSTARTESAPEKNILYILYRRRDSLRTTALPNESSLIYTCTLESHMHKKSLLLALFTFSLLLKLLFLLRKCDL